MKSIKYNGKTYCVPYIKSQNGKIYSEESEESEIERIIDKIVSDSLYEYRKSTNEYIKSLREEID
jgi:hypothetical protein